MSPEQADGRLDLLGPASDIYGLGATLYTLLTGRRPFEGEDVAAIVQQVRQGALVPPRRVKASVPAALEAVCLKAMALRPEERYPAALELAADVEHWLADEPVRAYPEPLRVRTRRWVRRHKPAVAAAAAAVLVTLLLGGGGWWWRAREQAAARAETERLVEADLREAEQRRSRAERSPAGDLTHWAAALAAVQRAENRLAGAEVDDGLRRRVGVRRAALGAKVAALEEEARDRRMLARLEEARLHTAEVRGVEFDSRRAEAAYAAAFRVYGIDVLDLPPATAAGRIRARPIRDTLVTALDDWAVLNRDRHQRPQPNPQRRKGRRPPVWGRLTRVARRADPDPLRNRLRAGLGGGIPTQSLRDLRELADRPGAVRSSQTLLLIAESLWLRGEYRSAVGLLRRAQRRFPADLGINFKLAWCLMDLRPPRWEESARYWMAALALRRQSAALWNNLGMVLDELGDLRGARAAFRQALRLKKDAAKAHNNLGATLFKLGDLKGAGAAFRRALRLRPDFPEAHANIGSILQEQGDLKGAVAAFRRALRLRKDSPGFHFNLGNVLHKQGDRKAAIAHYREALRLYKDFPGVYNNLGLALRESGDLPGAIRAFRHAIRVKVDDALAYNNLGAALDDRGDRKGAIAALQMALRFDPKLANAHYNLGNALQKQGDVPGAFAAYRQALRLNKDHPDAHRALGTLLMDMGNVAAAIRHYRKGLRLGKNDPRLHYNLGAALLQQGDLKGAVAAYRKAIRLKKDYELAHNGLSDVLLRLGDVKGAKAAAKEALRLKPDFPQALNNLGMALSRQGDEKGAITAYRKAVHLDKNFLAAHFNLGLSLFQVGDMKGSAVAFREALRLQKDNAKAHYCLGMALVQLGQFSEALAELRRGHALGSKDPSWTYPSRQWIQVCRRFRDLDRKLPAVRKGEAKPADAAEAADLARLCVHPYKRLYATAARLFADAFRDKPELASNLSLQHRFSAAGAAARAGSGQGRDATDLDDQGRAKWRKQALVWLRADLALWAQQLEKAPPQGRAAIGRLLGHWRQNPELAALRDKAGLAKLPEAEQKDCRRFWAEVAALAGRARGPK
jgi:Flp pilus assembly protein TadD